MNRLLTGIYREDIAKHHALKTYKMPIKNVDDLLKKTRSAPPPAPTPAGGSSNNVRPDPPQSRVLLGEMPAPQHHHPHPAPHRRGRRSKKNLSCKCDRPDPDDFCHCCGVSIPYMVGEGPPTCLCKIKPFPCGHGKNGVDMDSMDTLEIRFHENGQIIGFATSGQIPANLPCNHTMGRSCHSVSPEEIFGTVDLVEDREQRRMRSKKKVPAEVVTTNTVPLLTEDVDELVSMIEGTSIKSKKCSGKGPELDATKTAKKEKKERQREKKRLEEEAEKREEEERLRQLEEERIRQEQEEREEELRKKREKKKKRKNKKRNEGKEELEEPMVTVGPRDIRPTTLAPVMSREMDEPKPSKSSEMVTIRRHPTAPDTTVTISVKSETGNEDLLYTLVNGQVFSDVKTNGSLSNAKSPPPTSNAEPNKGKGKKKKKKQDFSPPEVTISSTGKANGHLTLENNLRSHEVNWFGAGTEFAPSLGHPALTPGVSTYLSPVQPSGPPQPSPAQTCRSYAPRKSFSYFTELGSDEIEIDLSKLKLPPGITITKVNQPVSGQGSDVSEEEYDPMPPPGAGLYDIDSNMIVMNPDCDEGDEDSYNSDDYFFHGRQRAGEFETVLSNKEKRKRIKANKVDETEGNGSSERPTSREQTPGATGNFSTGRSGKRGSDSGLKSSTNATPPGKRDRDIHRNSVSTKKDGTGTQRNPNGYKDGSNRKCRKDARKSTQHGGVARFTGKSDQHVPHPYVHPRARASPVFQPALSPGFGEIPPPLPNITPMNTVKMADVVSGLRVRTNRDIPQVPVAKIPKDSPPTHQAYSTKPFSSTTYNNIKVGDLDITLGPPLLPKPGYADKAQILTESNSNSFYNVPKIGGNYDMWRSNIGAPESPEPDLHPGGPSNLKSGNGPSSLDSKPGVWTWSADDESLIAAIRRPTPPYAGAPGASPVFRTSSPNGIKFGPVEPNPANLKYQFPDSHSHAQQQQPPPNSHPFVTTRQQAQVDSPLPFVSRQQVNSSPSPSFTRQHSHSIVQSINPFDHFYSMHGESGLPTPDTRTYSNGGSPDYFSSNPGIKLPPQLTNPGGTSQCQNFSRRPMSYQQQTPTPTPPHAGMGYGYPAQRNVGQSSAIGSGGVFPADPPNHPYLFCPIPLHRPSQESPPKLEPQTASGSQYTLF